MKENDSVLYKNVTKIASLTSLWQKNALSLSLEKLYNERNTSDLFYMKSCSKEYKS